MAVQGERTAGGFILVTSLDGIRSAVARNECRDETIMQHGGHVVRVPCSLDEAPAWFSRRGQTSSRDV